MYVATILKYSTFITITTIGFGEVHPLGSAGRMLTMGIAGAGIGSLGIAFSPDGWRIVAGCNDGIAEVWEAARPEQVAAWQQEERAAAQSLDALRREQAAEEEREALVRARDSIKQWLTRSVASWFSCQEAAILRTRTLLNRWQCWRLIRKSPVRIRSVPIFRRLRWAS